MSSHLRSAAPSRIPQAAEPGRRRALTVAAALAGAASWLLAGCDPQRIRELEARAQRQGQTQLFIETPYRNAALWQALVQTLQANTRLAIASGLTLDHARTASHLVRQWKQQPEAPDNRTPAVFSIGR